MFKTITVILISVSVIVLEGQRQGGGRKRNGPKKEIIQAARIGTFYTKENSVEKFAFELAVERNNRNSEGLPKLTSTVVELPVSSYEGKPKACQMLQEGVVSIFGPWSNEGASFVQSLCDAFEIPHIETRWDHDIRRGSYLMNLAPHPDTIARALADVVVNLEWDKYLLVYEDEIGLTRLSKILENSNPPATQGFVNQLPGGDDYRPWLYGILDGGDFRKIVLDCSPKKIFYVLKQAQEVGLLNADISFLVTSLDFYTINTEDFKYSRATILALSLIDPRNPEVASTLKLWEQFAVEKPQMGGYVAQPLRDSPEDSSAISWEPSESRKGRANNIVRMRKRDAEDDEESEEDEEDGEVYLPGYFTTDIALIFDAVDLLAHALKAVNDTQRIEGMPLHCEGVKYWRQGFSIINQMKTMKLEGGLTGLIHFNTTGLRSDFGLDIIQLTEKGIIKVGAWDTKFVNKVKWASSRPTNRKPEPVIPPSKFTALDVMRGKTITVTTIMTDPLMMWKISEFPLEGNDRYEGFSVELLTELSHFLGFKFIINPVKDKRYGSQNAKGEWNGMIREVMDGVADIAVADLTINKQRQRAVDFTMPYMTLGISILYVAPKAKPPSLLSFMAPMGVEVWLLLCAAIVGTSVTLHLCARLTPYEWVVPHPCIHDPDELEYDFNLFNCFCYTLGTYLGQGAEMAPKATSTRMLAGFWFLFCLIMVSSYTANLAAFLVVQDLDERIKSVEDLPKQSYVKYGCLASGTTLTFFKTSPFPIYQQIYQNMVEMSKTDSEIFKGSNKAGMERVVADKGGYAFFMESTGIEYNVERNCKLSKVGGLLDNKAYGIALRKGSNYTQALSSGILKLQEKGVLDELRRKWWTEERKANACDGDDSEEEEGGVQPLTLAHVGGIFLVVLFGCLFAILVSCVEVFLYAREVSAEKELLLGEETAEHYPIVTSDVPMGREIRNLLTFALACKSNVKQIEDDDDAHGDSSCHSETSKKSDHENTVTEKHDNFGKTLINRKI